MFHCAFFGVVLNGLGKVFKCFFFFVFFLAFHINQLGIKTCCQIQY